MIYWDETSPDTRAFDAQNCLVFVTGPIAGFTRFAGCRWQICGKSPEMQPEAFSYANLGGSWGSWLKYAGYDGLVVTGRANRPQYILIEGDNLEIRNASEIWGKTTIETQNILQAGLGKEAKVLSIGPAAENRVTFATILAAENASGSSGFGSVMGSKNLKAIVVKASNKKRIQAADPDSLKSLAIKSKPSISNFGTTDTYYQEDATYFLYGCISGCTRWTYEAENGNKFKSFCQAGGVYIGPAMKYYGDGTEANLLAGRLCDKYGLDTVVMSPLVMWLEQCYQAGILSDAETGLPLSKIGSIEFIETLVRKISFREGFGDILAQGILKAAEQVGKGSRELLGAVNLNKAGENYDYDPRLILANAMTYATEPRRAVHLHHATVLPLKRWINWLEGWKDAFLTTDILRDIAEKLWGSSEAFDFSTYRGKALAAKKIQDYGYVKESLILCDLAWPIFQVHSPDPSIIPGTLEINLKRDYRKIPERD
jgi:aldehyde:ferredoxin oxidoreductase